MTAPMTRFEALKAHLEARLSAHVFVTWFAPLRCVSETSEDLVLGVPNAFALNWINDHYRDVLDDSFRTTGAGRLELRIAPEDPKPLARSDSKPQKVAAVELPTVSSAPNAATRERLNAKYHFDAFVVGPSNQLAFSAAKSVGERSTLSFSPLVLVGRSGLGKTHLLHAIAHSVLDRHDKKRPVTVVLKTSEQFVMDVVRGIRTQQMDDVRRAYRHADVLLIDDIQLISGKGACQEEFFHTFNVLYDAKKQIVVTSDRPPHEIPELEERIRTRFAWGLIAELKSPDLDTRLAILQKKSAVDGIPLSSEVASLLAQQIRTNVRELEGALVRLYATSSLTGRPMSLELAREVLELADRNRPVTVDQIVEAVSAHFNVEVGEIKSEQRKKTIALPRQISMYLCRRHTKSSYPDIGRAHGGKHHTTVMNAEEQIERRLTDPDVRQHVEDIQRLLEID
ncbi:MAG: chromosomal replication initiator protein DnaA [Deltaproteobacteria bacterium]|nr:chromosomal replication initiator protein DnaA [Deltaproteobacteria bacterium]